MLATLVFNLSSKVRHETLNGRAYMVAPCVMGIEGVLNGSRGPGFYPATEWEKSVVGWNMKPIVVTHPAKDGQSISAANKDIIENSQIGIVMNTHYDDKMRTECWFDVEKTKAVDSRIYDALINNTVMEVSTGLAVDREEVNGTHNGVPYTWIARNHRPDHLAILPDDIGACPVASGAGLLVTNGQFPEALTMNAAATKSGADAKEAMPIMSLSDLNNLVCEALCEKFEKPGYEWNGWGVDVFPDFVVYRADGDLFRLSYTIKDTTVTFVGDPTPVIRVTEYRDVVTNVVAGITANVSYTLEKLNMNRKEAVDQLIANSGGRLGEDDRAFLTGAPDAQFAKMQSQFTAPAPAPAPAPVVTNAAPVNSPAPAAAPELTFNQLLDKAPPMYKQLIEQGLASLQAEKTRLIEGIVANKKNAFTPEYLATCEPIMLRGLHALAVDAAPASPPMFYGQQGAAHGVVTNSVPVFEPTLTQDPLF